MKRSIVTLGILASCLLPAAAETPAATPYRYYAVKAGDTVEMVARRNAVSVEQILELNPALKVDPCLEFRTFVFVPLPTRAKPRPKTVAPAAAPMAVASAAKSPPAQAPEPVKPGSSTELSDDEVEALYEEVVSRHAGRVAAVVQPQLPTHQNVFIDASGRAMSVPCAPPPKKAPEPETPGRRSLSSRRGLKTQEILRSSLKLLSVPYVWGGEDRSGVDCSGFVQLVFGWNGVRLPRTADLQYEVGRAITAGKEQPGDLVFFETYCPGASHVGIFLGHRQFVHASSTAGVVTISNLDEARFQACYLGAKRVW